MSTMTPTGPPPASVRDVDHPESRAFVASILAEPEDDTRRLAFADWLEEHGQADRAEFVRCQIFTHNHRHSGRRSGSRRPPAAAREWELYGEHGVFPLCGTDPRQWLFHHVGEGRLVMAGPPDLAWFERGFVGHAHTTAADWIAYGADLSAAHPIRELTVTEWAGREQSLSAKIGPRIRTLHLDRSAEITRSEAVALLSYSRQAGWDRTLELLDVERVNDGARRRLLVDLPRQMIRVGGVLYAADDGCGGRAVLEAPAEAGPRGE